MGKAWILFDGKRLEIDGRLTVSDGKRRCLTGFDGVMKMQIIESVLIKMKILYESV
jgi:hypothetical protein